MNNIFFGLFLAFILTLFYLLLSWKQWKKSGYIWSKTKEEKEKNLRSYYKIMPFIIVAIAVLPRLINTTLIISTSFFFVFFSSIICWKLDPYFRSKNKQ